MMSHTVKDFRETDPKRRRRGIGRIMLSLASKSQTCTGSLQFNDDGSTKLVGNSGTDLVLAPKFWHGLYTSNLSINVATKSVRDSGYSV